MMHTSSRYLGRLLGFTSLLILLESSGAFQPHKQNLINYSPTTKSDDKKTVMTDEMRILPESGGDSQKKDLIDIDIDKAEDFASHFGKYSYGEIEHMRDDLHTHRVQNMALGNDEYSNDVLFLERFLENDLTSQLKALQDDMPEPYLFRYPNKDPDTKAKVDPIPSPNIFHETSDEEDVAKRKNSDLYEELAMEGVVESLAICAILGFLMMAPGHVV